MVFVAISLIVRDDGQPIAHPSLEQEMIDWSGCKGVYSSYTFQPRHLLYQVVAYIFVLPFLHLGLETTGLGRLRFSAK